MSGAPIQASGTNPADAAKEFMLKEYEQIVQAFFEAGKQNTLHFNYYITLVTAPITLIGAIFGILKIQGGAEWATLQIQDLPNFVGLIIMIIAAGGFLMSIIISDSRLDALLYARVLNEVRRYFVEKHGVPKEYLFLPVKSDVPKYNEITHFRALGAELILVSLLDSVLLLLSFAIIWQMPIKVENLFSVLSVPSVLFLVLHIGFYFVYAWYRQRWDKASSAKYDGQ